MENKKNTFNLSDDILIVTKKAMGWEVIETKDVREFVKRLKEACRYEYDPLNFEKKLNKLAGEELS